jgi:hypothetical protein
MNIYLLAILRTIHIFAGALWIGAAIAYLFFFKPSVKAVGPAGPQFMQTLTGRRKYPLFMVGMSLLNVLAGILLYLFRAGSLNLAWVNSGPGWGYTLGALAGLVAFFVGNFAIGPTAARLGALGQQIGAAGGPPSPTQLTTLHALEQKLERAEWIDFAMLTLSMLAMITARFWLF